MNRHSSDGAGWASVPCPARSRSSDRGQRPAHCGHDKMGSDGTEVLQDTAGNVRAPVAQWIEQPPPKRKVASSTLAWGTTRPGTPPGPEPPPIRPGSCGPCVPRPLSTDPSVWLRTPARCRLIRHIGHARAWTGRSSGVSAVRNSQWTVVRVLCDVVFARWKPTYRIPTESRCCPCVLACPTP
jgi:hypothetical protein